MASLAIFSFDFIIPSTNDGDITESRAFLSFATKLNNSSRSSSVILEVKQTVYIYIYIYTYISYD